MVILTVSFLVGRKAAALQTLCNLPFTYFLCERVRPLGWAGGVRVSIKKSTSYTYVRKKR